MVDLGDFTIDSAGTSGFHQGEPADSRMIEHARKRGLDLTSLSRQFVVNDFDRFDYILVMDDKNLRDVLKMASVDQAKKVRKITDFSQKFKYDHIPDPYYGGAKGFDLVLDLLVDACEGFLKSLKL